ncbi:MAG: UPF0158 family protein [Bacteroidota bacterium]
MSTIETPIRQFPPGFNLKTFLQEIMFAFQESDPFHESHYVLNLKTLELILITDEISSECEQVVNGHKTKEEVPEWMLYHVDEIRDMMEFPQKYRRIDSFPSFQSYKVMEKFAGSVDNTELRGNLLEALRLKKPFRNFRAVLDDYPQYLEKWYNYRDDHDMRKVKQWLVEEDIISEDLLHGVEETDTFYDRVLRGLVEVDVVAENDHALAFYHTNPYWPEHVVVIPKKRSRTFTEFPDGPSMNGFMTLLREVAQKVEAKFGGCRVVTNVGDYQTEKFMHWHVYFGKKLR